MRRRLAMAISSTPTGPGCSYVDPALVEQLSVPVARADVRMRNEHVRHQREYLGEDAQGMPIRKSVAERLIQRIGLEA